MLDALGMTEEIEIINCEDTEVLRTMFESKKVAICEKAWLALADAIQGHPVEDRVYDEKTAKAAWNIVKDWCFPKSDADLDLAERELQGMTIGRDEEPRLFISRLEGKIWTLKSMGLEKGDGEIVRIIRRNLLAEYDVEKRTSLLESGLNIQKMGDVLQTSYKNRKVTEMEKGKSGSASAVDPHALAVTNDGQGSSKRDGFWRSRKRRNKGWT